VVKTTGDVAMSDDLKDRERFEEDNFIRLTETKLDKKKRKAGQRIKPNDELDLDYFGDLNPIREREVDDQLGGLGAKAPSKVEQLMAKAKKSGGQQDYMEDYDMDGEGADFYEQTKVKQKKKVAQREEDHPNPAYHYGDIAPESIEDGDRRKATNAILKNRGMVRYRPKESHNPRAAKRKKFDKTMVKWNSTNKVYTGKTNEYAGEKSGIKSNVVKSTKL
jgi:U3 small nucleolar RNA-associated protein 3